MNTLPYSPLPEVSGVSSGNRAGLEVNLVEAGASFTDLARTILAADPAADTIAELTAAIRAGQDAYNTEFPKHVAAMRTANDPLATDAEADAARLEVLRLAAKLTRIVAASEAVDERFSALLIRQRAEAAAAAKNAARARHAVANAAVVERYPALAAEMAALFAELQLATAECQSTGVGIDNAAGRALGVIGAGGTIGVAWLPKLTVGARYWPADPYAAANAAMAVPMKGLPTLADLTAREMKERN